MAINTDRIIFFIIFVNIIIGMSNTAYKTIGGEETNLEAMISWTTHYTQKLDTQEQSLKTEDAKWGGVTSTSLVSETSTIGNALKIGGFLFDTILEGISPISVGPWDFTNTVEQTISYFIIFFRVLMLPILGMLLYDKFKNKKVD